MSKKKNKKEIKKEEVKKINSTKKLKNVKNPKRKDTSVEKTPSEIKKLGLLLIYILLVVSIVYLITLFFVDGTDDFFSSNNNSTETDENGNTKLDEEMDYSIIPVGSTFSSSGTDYYVLFYDMSDDDNSNLTSAASANSEKKVYKVDLSKAINKKVIAENGNKNAQSVDELQIKEPTLIKISNGRNVLYLEEFADIVKELQ